MVRFPSRVTSPVSATPFGIRCAGSAGVIVPATASVTPARGSVSLPATFPLPSVVDSNVPGGAQGTAIWCGVSFASPRKPRYDHIPFNDAIRYLLFKRAFREDERAGCPWVYCDCAGPWAAWRLLRELQRLGYPQVARRDWESVWLGPAAARTAASSSV